MTSQTVKSYYVDKQTHTQTDTTENNTTFATLPMRGWRKPI